MAVDKTKQIFVLKERYNILPVRWSLTLYSTSTLKAMIQS